MTDYLYYLLVGCGAGAIIAVFALGLVITHLGSGIVNFAHGATAMWITYVYADLRNGAYVLPIPGLPGRYHFGHDVGYRWALTLSMLTAVAIGLLEYLLVFRPLRTAPALAKVVASVGLLIVFTSLVEGRFADKITIRVNEILPKKSVTLAEGLTIPRDGLWLAVVALVITLLLWLLYRFTRFGLATRAAAECEKGAVLLGYSPDLLAGVNLVIATVVAGLIGILASPLLQLSASIYTFGFLIPALGAALIGRFRHFWPTLLTALAIGMTQSMFTKLQNDLSWFPKYGAREGLPFLIIIATMVLLGERLPGRGNTEATKLPTVPLAKITPFAVVVPAIAGVIGLLVLGPLWRAAIMTTLIAAVLALSNVVLTGFAGQTSLSQLAFAGVAGFSLAKLATHAHVPFPLAPLLAVVGAGVLGTLVGLPALRVRGTNLAIVTLAGGVAIAEFVFKNPAFVGTASTGGAKIGNPKLGPWDMGLVLGTKSSRPIFGIMLLAVLVVTALGVTNLRRSSTGRRMLAVRSNERAAAAAGINVARTKVLAYGISSLIAGIAGTLIAYRFGSVSDVSYGTVASLTALAVAYLGGITSVSGAITSGIVAASGVAFFTTSRVVHSLGRWEALIGGVLLIFTAIQNPEGIAGAIRMQSQAARAKKASKAAAGAVSGQFLPT